MQIKSFLTYNDERNPDLIRPEPVDALADEDPGVVLAHRADLERARVLALRAVLVRPGVVADALAVLVPLHHGRGVAGDGAHQLDGLAEMGDAIHVSRLGVWWAWRGNVFFKPSH